MTDIDDAIAAAAFRRLIAHFQHRTDAQNVDLMGLAGLSKLPGRLDRGCFERNYQQRRRARTGLRNAVCGVEDALSAASHGEKDRANGRESQTQSLIIDGHGQSTVLRSFGAKAGLPLRAKPHQKFRTINGESAALPRPPRSSISTMTRGSIAPVERSLRVLAWSS